MMAFRLGRYAAGIFAATGLAGCVGSAFSTPNTLAPVGLVPRELRPIGIAQLHGVPASKDAKRGIYVSTLEGIFGYSVRNRHNKSPMCMVSGSRHARGIGVDRNGNLIEANGVTHKIIVFQGPDMCGPKLGSVRDSFGQPYDVSSSNAATGKIAVGNIAGNSGVPGSVSVCTLSGGCTINLTNSNMHEVAGVAMAKNGDCWASAADSLGTATLTYFKGCSGSGEAATGFRNEYYGGLDIDGNGNLVSISIDGRLYVYNGCNPSCTLVGGPFKMEGECVFGHLDKKSARFVAADYQFSQIDVYTYNPTNVQYEYSFNTGLQVSDEVQDAAYNPPSKE